MAKPRHKPAPPADDATRQDAEEIKQLVAGGMWKAKPDLVT